jgi:signal transduction histidine kinase
MRDAVKRADRIVRELLQLAADTEVAMMPEELNSVVETALSLVHYELLAAKLTVVRQLGANLPRVPLDRIKMEQVLVNLLLNACQATPHGGTVTVTTRTGLWTHGPWRSERWGGRLVSGDPVVIAEVQDTGVGIPEDDLARVFDPFFTTKTDRGGTGLGLSIVKNIVDLHGGSISLENVAEGGARVSLILKSQAA